MATRSAEPSVRRSFDASPWRPLRTAAGGSSPHSASTSCSVGTTRPTCSASTASSARSFAPATTTSRLVVVEHLEPTEQPDAHGWTVARPDRIFSARSASGQPWSHCWRHDHQGQPRHLGHPMSAIEHALLAVMAADDGDAATAEGHISSAQRYARITARRDRQIVEIAALVVAGHRRARRRTGPRAHRGVPRRCGAAGPRRRRRPVVNGRAQGTWTAGPSPRRRLGCVGRRTCGRGPCSGPPRCTSSSTRRRAPAPRCRWRRRGTHRAGSRRCRRCTRPG